MVVPGNPLFFYFDLKDDQVLAEFETHIKMTGPVPTTC